MKRLACFWRVEQIKYKRNVSTFLAANQLCSYHVTSAWPISKQRCQHLPGIENRHSHVYLQSKQAKNNYTNKPNSATISKYAYSIVCVNTEKKVSLQLVNIHI